MDATETSEKKNEIEKKMLLNPASISWVYARKRFQTTGGNIDERKCISIPA